MLDIVRPSDPRYEDVRHVYVRTGSPAAVLRPGSAYEVAEALGRARQAAGPLAIRSGGHGISSVATNVGGTVIDLARMNTVERVRAGENLVRIGPGARWGEVAAALHPWGLSISSGDSGDVGVGGLATTGGIGLMGRAHGLAIDHMVGAEIVTADGTIHRVDSDHEPNLFWAIRGAGANMGIVTSMVFRAAPVSVVGHATLHYQVGHVAPFLRTWGEVVEAAPREISAFLYLMGGGFALAALVFAGDDPVAAERALSPFLQVAPVVGQQARIVPYAGVVSASHTRHRGQQQVGRTHTGLSVHLDGELSGRLEDLVQAGFGELLQVRSVGGAINDVPADATAYAHRHQNFSITAVTGSRLAEFDAMWEHVLPCLDGLYLSFESEFSPSRLSAAFPSETLYRLREIKKAVDPEGVFQQNFPVTP